MSKYPLVNINKQEWSKKVNACLMYTIPSQEEALPTLKEFQQILQRLLTYPYQQTLPQDHKHYFFIDVFPVACQKIIKSRYFRNQTVLRVSNKILTYTLCLLPTYIQFVDACPQFIEIIQATFPDQHYFKTNNQLDPKNYPFLYFKQKVQDTWIQQLRKQMKLDVMKFSGSKQKFSWSHATILQRTQTSLYIQYDLDYQSKSLIIDLLTQSHRIAPYQSQCKTFQWRKAIKQGDVIDALDSFGGWYNATVLEVEEQEDGRRKVEVTMKVYNVAGAKVDQGGRFFGFNDYKEKYDAFGAEIAPYCSVAKEFYYQSSKLQFQTVDDQNDMEYYEYNGKKIYALPRRKNLSQTIFIALNMFGQLGGFEKSLQKIQQKADLSMLAGYLKGLSGVSPYLHKRVVIQQIQRLKVLLQKNILSQNNSYNKQKSQMLFSGLRSLLKRIYTTQVSYTYENNLKIKLVELNFKHDSLKKKLHGLNQLKEIIKSLTYGSQRNQKIIDWIKQQKIFEKVYLSNSHVQLIKKSQSFFRYIINEQILQLQDFQKLLKMAQKGDYETRISLYSLFQQVSNIFKKNHVNFLIDKILQSETNLTTKQDIDLLHQLSRFSNYFPTQKVMQFFQKLTLGQEIPQQINLYSIKKYSEMVSKNYQLKTHRKEIIKNLMSKLNHSHVHKVTKILRAIFEGIAVGQWGKKDLTDILQELDFDSLLIETITTKQDAQKPVIIKQCMDLLLKVYKLCPSIKIQMMCLTKIYQQTKEIPLLLSQYISWCYQVFSCQQQIILNSITQLQTLFTQLFHTKQEQAQSTKIFGLDQLDLLKSMFIQINKRKKFIFTWGKDSDKEFKRKVPMKQLRFYQTLSQFLYHSTEKVAQKALDFFTILYCAGENTQQQIETFLNQNIMFMKQVISQQMSNQQQLKIIQTLKLISLIIDDSEKECTQKVLSLSSRQKSYQVKLHFHHQTMCQTIKKMQVTIPIHFTLYDLRSHLAKQLDIPCKAIKIQHKSQLGYEKNCWTIKELGLTSDDLLIVTRKQLQQEQDQDIILNGDLNPKSIRAFKTIFQLYSTQGMMNKQQCQQFTIKCLGSASSPKFYQDKINNLFKQYDENKDDFLQLGDFLKFYKDAALARPSTVWSNLKSFKVQSNFQFVHESSMKSTKPQLLPRNLLAQVSQFYCLLFSLLNYSLTSTHAFNLLLRLPISKELQEEILAIGQDQFKFQEIFKAKQMYAFFYRFKIVSYLLLSQEFKTQHQHQWANRFISSNGYQYLINQFIQFIHNYQIDQTIDRKLGLQILDAFIQVSITYLMKCYVTKSIFQSQALFCMQLELNEKIQYLQTKTFTKKDVSFPQIPQNMIQQYQNLSIPKQKILQNILNLLQYLWKRKSSIKQSNIVSNCKSSSSQFEYLQLLLISKIMILIPALQINENFHNLMARMEGFINNTKNQKILIKMYQLIIIMAFYSQQANYQKVIINQMFKCLTMKNVVSEHFNILAKLVSKYGVETINQDQIIITLIDNIFNSDNQLTLEGCSRLLLNFDLTCINQKQFDKIWQTCLFGEHKRAKKPATRQALYELILKSSSNKPCMSSYIIRKIKTNISQCIQHMRITSCNQDNQRSLTGYAGLKNLGNICYINSMMQQLYMNKQFRYLLLRIKDFQPQNLAIYKEKNYDDNILHQVQRIFSYLQLTTRADFVPTGFCLAYKPFGESVNVMMQQDVQQFVSMFFDQLENKIKQTPFKSIIDNLYAGKTVNLFNCHDCNQTKKVEENFYSITLQVKNSKTLSQSFNRYVSGELISDFRCDFCNKKVDVSKKTRIAKAPKTLIIHLQRIVFNLDTFINQKLTTRHQFPLSLDLYPYSLSQYQKPKDTTPQQMIYSLSGIICHIGNAQSGHYVSYIKRDQKWLEFNDSLVMGFSQDNIQAECFGGQTNINVLDDYQWDKTNQTTKSAYVLLYQKLGHTTLQAHVKSIQQKDLFFKQYSLSQVLDKISSNKQTNQNQSVKQSESQQISDSEQLNQQNLQQQMQKLVQQQIIRKKSLDLDLSPSKFKQLKQQVQSQKQISCLIDPNISAYISQQLKSQILHDNQIHFFQKNLSSPVFVKFFANLLREEHDCVEEVSKMLKNLTFGFWAKSNQFKQLLETCLNFIQKDNQYADLFVFNNPHIVTYLIENSDIDVRTAVADFLANSFSILIKKHNLTLIGQNQLDTKIVAFLDTLFSLLPTQVSKSWTKFSQYFQFWYQFAKKGQIQVGYMIKKQILKHFLDYFLQKKSPLKIYQNKPQIGSKYANPNFNMLLKCVTHLITCITSSSQLRFSSDDLLILIHFQCMQKLITQQNQCLAINLIKQICLNNLSASQKLAIILIKGLHKSTFNNVQPYLDVLHAYVLIDDNIRDLRINWVLGKPQLNISTISKQIHSMIAYGLEDRVYTYTSTIIMEQASSLLDPIYQLHKRAENFVMMSLKQALKLCTDSEHIFNYIWTLPPPSLIFGRIYQFYEQFIDKYIEDSKKSYNYNQAGFNKEELGKQTKELFDKLMIRWIQKHQQVQKVEQKKESDSAITQISSEHQTVQKSEQSISQSPVSKPAQTPATATAISGIYYPVKLHFKQTQRSTISGLEITHHTSQLSLILLQPNGKTNLSFSSSAMQQNIQKILPQVWKNQRKQIISGYFVFNPTKNLLRIQTENGTQTVKSNDYLWVWDQHILRVWECQKGSDYPKWQLYSLQN